MRLSLSATIASVLLIECAFAARLEVNYQPITADGWADFALGSWVQANERMKSSGEAREQTLRIMLVGREGSESQLKIDQMWDDESERVSARSASKKQQHFEAGEPRQGEFKIGERTVQCTIVEHTLTIDAPDFKRNERLVLWTTDDVKIPSRMVGASGLVIPENVVKAEYSRAQDEGEPITQFTLEVTDLAQSLEIGDRAVSCIVEEMQLTGRAGNMNMKRWLSYDVPGHEVKKQFEMAIERRGEKVESTYHWEAIDYCDVRPK